MTNIPISQFGLHPPFGVFKFQNKVCMDMNNLIMADKKKDKIYEDNDEKQFLKLRVSFAFIV